MNRLVIYWVWKKQNLSLLINRNLQAVSVFGFRGGQISPLTLYLQVLFADYFCKQFGPRSGRTKRQAWSASNLFDTLIVFLKELFEKVNFEKKNSRQQKMGKKFPGGKELLLVGRLALWIQE